MNFFKDESIGTNNCPNGWYKVNVNGQDGYICSNYLKVSVVDEPKVDDTEALTECEKEMKEKRISIFLLEWFMLIKTCSSKLEL